MKIGNLKQILEVRTEGKRGRSGIEWDDYMVKIMERKGESL